jgi:diguanylate cyclase (GGDEF)-like protein/PAS domain S-box-containing protein
MAPFEDPGVYRDILDGLQIGVSVLDTHHKIVFWSDGAEQITGYARIDVLGHFCSENILLHCDRNSCEMCVENCFAASALQDGKAAESLISIHHRAGHWIPVRAWTIPLRDKKGSIIGAIQTFESEFAANGPDPNDRSMKERGCLDYATDLPNHAMMQSHLRESLGTFAELEIPFAIVFLEVQELAQFRAKYGQEGATSMVRVLARTLRNAVWPTDFVGRWEDDRFLVILSGCDADALHIVRERMLRRMAGVTIQWWGQELSLTMQIGSTSAVAGDTIESLVLRSQADVREARIANLAGGSPQPDSLSNSTTS